MSAHESIESRPRYFVLAVEDDDGELVWFVVDRTGRLDPRLMGVGRKARNVAVWLARVLNG